MFFFFCSVFLLPPQPPAKFLLPEVSIADYGRNCVVIDLDETLVHSSFKVIRRKQTPFSPRVTHAWRSHFAGLAGIIGLYKSGIAVTRFVAVNADSKV